MWWKIYFWIYLILNIIGLVALLPYAPFKAGYYVSFFITAVTILGLFSYVFKRKIFSVAVWRIFLSILIVTLLEGFLELFVLPKQFVDTYLTFFRLDIPVNAFDWLLTLILSLPALYASFVLALATPKTIKTVKKIKKVQKKRR